MTNRSVIANITLTLDGRTTGPGGPHDMSCIAPHGASEQGRDALVAMTTATVALVGRHNYAGFAGYWPLVAADETADPRDRAFAQWLDQVDKVVFSRTLDDPLEWSNSQLADADPAQTVKQLRSAPGGDIRVLSSQSIINQLLEADEIDRLELTLAPELVGGGARLFSEALPPSSWTLLTTTTTDTHAVQLTYQRATERSIR